MPRVVDHEQRRRELAAAAFALARRGGLAAVSVRAVAQEAGTTPSALRHYFPSQPELLRQVMGHVVQSAGDRVRAVPRTGRPVDVATAQLLELLPLDDERAAEADVWLAFSAAALTEPGLRALRTASDAALEGLCARVVLSLRAQEEPDDGARAAAAHLWALLDGLALHLRLAPERTSAARATAVLRSALEALAAPAARLPGGDRGPV